MLERKSRFTLFSGTEGVKVSNFKISLLIIRTWARLAWDFKPAARCLLLCLLGIIVGKKMVRFQVLDPVGVMTMNSSFMMIYLSSVQSLSLKSWTARRATPRSAHRAIRLCLCFSSKIFIQTSNFSIKSKFFYTRKLLTFPSYRFNFNQTSNFSVN